MIPGATEIPDPQAEMNRLAAERQDPARVRALLDHAVTVVKPGETLIIRADPQWTPLQVRGYQEHLDAWHDSDSLQRLPFRAVVMLGEEFAVMEKPGVPG